MFVVTLPTSANPVKYAARAHVADANLLEVRGDLTLNVEPFESPLPLLVSPRGAGIKLIEQLQPDYIDLELDEDVDPSAFNFQPSTIRSYHNYSETPDETMLKKLCDEMMAMNADIIKIAVQINSYADLQRLDSLHAYIPADQKRCLLGMGTKAHLNRMRSPHQNALTYTYLGEGEQAAEGQVPLSMYKLTEHTNSPRLFGILGNLEVQSLSPLIHNTLFQKHGIDALYSTMLTDNLDDAWENLTALGAEGFSVTSPWKQAIISKLDELSPEAEELGTVNTAVKKDGKWIGYTRDPYGLVAGYPFLQGALSAGIIGSGGVVPSVIHACREAQIMDIRVFARNTDARDALAAQFSIGSEPLEQLDHMNMHVLFMCISDDVCPALPTAPDGAHAIDLRYGKPTKFMEEAKHKGYTVHDGIGMLAHQALAQFHLFTGQEPTAEDADLVFSTLTQHGQ